MIEDNSAKSHLTRPKTTLNPDPEDSGLESVFLIFEKENGTADQISGLELKEILKVA